MTFKKSLKGIKVGDKDELGASFFSKKDRITTLHILLNS
jgi:hypothetical protein